MIITRERSTFAANNYELNEGNVSDSEDDCGDVMEMEAELIAMTNGEN